MIFSVIPPHLLTTQQQDLLKGVLVHIAPSLQKDIAELITTADVGENLLLVSDDNTYAALGHQVEKALAGKYNITRCDLGSRVKPDTATVTRIRNRLAACDSAIAIGSGSINDLCKYASFLEGKPYLLFATAPSMNGYLSITASIETTKGKQSFKAQLPRAAFFDLGVLAAAPKRLIQSGIGDSLCRPTAQADWLLSHLLLDTAYDPLPFALTALYESVLFDSPEGLVRADIAAMDALVRLLIASGIGMTLAGGSHPASQGEHMIAHAYGMLAGNVPSYHGEEIGVITLEMAELQSRILTRMPVLKKCSVSEQQLCAIFGTERGTVLFQEWKQKELSPAAMEAVNQRIAGNWAEVQSRISAISLSRKTLHEVLRKTGAPDTIAKLSWDSDLYRHARTLAAFTRNRFTFLDLEVYE